MPSNATAQTGDRVLGRRHLQQADVGTLGRRHQLQKSIIQPVQSKRIGVKAVAKEVPGVIKRGTVKAADMFIPGITEFVRTSGGIIGEGLAYALDENVQEQYKAGNLDILPNISKTSHGDLWKKTAAAGIEVAVLRSFPKAMQANLVKRGGIGLLQGVGFAVSEGLAQDKSADEIMDSMRDYGVAGSVITMVTPYLLPLLKKEVGKVPKVVKDSFKKADDVPPSSLADEVVPEQPVAEKPTTANDIKSSPDAVEVPYNRLPVDGPTNTGKLEQRLMRVADEDAAQGRVLRNALDEPLDAASNKEQMRRAARAVGQMTDEQIDDVLRGNSPTPEGILDNAFIKAAMEKANMEMQPGLMMRIASNLSKRFGQEIQFLRNFDPLDPSTKMSEVLTARTAAAERKLKRGQTLQTVKKETKVAVQKEMTKSQMKIDHVEKLLDDILC